MILTPALFTTFAWIVAATGSFARPSVMMMTTFWHEGRGDSWKSVKQDVRASWRLVEPPTNGVLLQADEAVARSRNCVSRKVMRAFVS